MFERKYEIVPNAPAHTSWDDYSKISLKEYRNLLETASDDETALSSAPEIVATVDAGKCEIARK